MVYWFLFFSEQESENRLRVAVCILFDFNRFSDKSKKSIYEEQTSSGSISLFISFQLYKMQLSLP